MSTAPRKRKEADKTPSVRVDKWLWAARFFRTRSMAATAVKGGKVHVNGQRAKASTAVHAGDRLEITKGDIGFEIDVSGLREQRGPASEAQQLYLETPASLAERERRAQQRRAARISVPRLKGRPDKKQRRQLRQFKQGD